MRIAVIGAGAIGCYLAAKLAAAGENVVVVARGATLDAIGRDGIRVSGNETVAARPATIDMAAIARAAPADLVLTCVKAYSSSDVAPLVAKLLGATGAWIPVLNGLPWWFRTRSGEALNTVDPGGGISRLVGRERVIAGTDCGFGTFAGFGKMDPEISYKKLAALVEGAKIASRRLWR